MPFPPHQCNVKVLGTQCLQACLTNRDFDKVLAKTGVSAGARTRVNPLQFSHFPSVSTRLENVSFWVQRADDSLPTDQLTWDVWMFIFKMSVLKRLRKKTFTIMRYENSPEASVYSSIKPD